MPKFDLRTPPRPRPSASIFSPSGFRLRRLRRLVVPPSATIPPLARSWICLCWSLVRRYRRDGSELVDEEWRQWSLEVVRYQAFAFETKWRRNTAYRRPSVRQVTQLTNTPASPCSSIFIFLITIYKSPSAVLDMHHLTCGISSLLHSVNLILFTLLHGSRHSAHITSSQSPSSLSPPITLSAFYSRLKIYLFHHTFHP